MGLDTVYAAVVAKLRSLTDNSSQPLLKGVSEGPTEAIPQSPYCWVQMSSFDVPAQPGSEIETTTWQFDVRLIWEWAPDPAAAERNLAGLLEPIRTALRSNQQLGMGSTVRRVWVGSGDWLYMVVNEITYRCLDLRVAVTEKLTVSYAA